MDKPCAKEISFVRCMKCMKIFQCSRHDTSILLEHIRTDHPEVYTDPQSKLKANKKTCTSDASAKSVSKINCEPEPDREDVECQCGCMDNEGEENEINEIKPPLAKDIDLTQYSLTSEILDKYPEIQNCEYIPEDANTNNRPHKRRFKRNLEECTTIGSTHSPQKHNLYRTSIEKWRPANGKIYCPKCGCYKRPLIKTRAERISSNQCWACCLLSCWPLCFLPCFPPGQEVEYLYCANCQDFLGQYDRNTNCIRPNRLFVNAEEPCQQDTRNRSENYDNCRCDKDEQQPYQDKGNGDKNSINSEISEINSVNESERLPTISVNGKEVPPETVARLKKYKRLGSLAGFDMDDYTDKASTNTPNRNDSFKETQKAPPVDNIRNDKY